jgi:hypothetical protein
MRDLLPPGARNSRDWFRPEGFTALRVLTSEILQAQNLSCIGIRAIPRNPLELQTPLRHLVAITSAQAGLNQRKENFGGVKESEALHPSSGDEG